MFAMSTIESEGGVKGASSDNSIPTPQESPTLLNINVRGMSLDAPPERFELPSLVKIELAEVSSGIGELSSKNSNPRPVTTSRLKSQEQPSKKLLTFNVSFEVKGKVLLDNAFADVQSGECLAIMGPSGAGKMLKHSNSK
jgi:ABC-type glutathione transport system ATPase component